MSAVGDIADEGDEDEGGGEVREFVVEDPEKPRLDAWLTARDLGISRAQVQRLIDDGDVLVDGAVPAKAGIRLRRGSRIAVTIRAPVSVMTATWPAGPARGTRCRCRP